MIEQQFPIEIPPGLVMNGSLMERAGRWENGNYVRFHNGIARAMGAATTVTIDTSVGTDWNTNDGPIKAMYRYHAASGGLSCAIGRHTKLFVVRSIDSIGRVNIVDPITPIGGLPDQGDTNSWSFSNLGSNLLITNAGWPTAAATAPFWVYTDGGGDAVVVDSTTVYRGVFVTPERFVMLIENKNTLTWPSQDTYDDLTPTASNSAGSLDVPTPYLVITGRPLVSESLVWTEGDLWALTYVGGDLIYGLRKVGDNCGILGANNVAITNGVARWMGQGGFFEYDGYVRPLECPLSEWVFGDIARSHAHRFFTVPLPQFNAVQFWFMSGIGNDYCDRFVEYNYANGTWTKGEDIYRTAGIGEWPLNPSSGRTGASELLPLMGSSTYNVLKLHERDTGGLQGDNVSADIIGPYLRSGPIHMPEGKNVKVQKIIHDTAFASDEITLYAGAYPNDDEVVFGPYAVPIGSTIDTRFIARYVRYQQTLGINSGVGIPRLGIIPGGSDR